MRGTEAGIISGKTHLEVAGELDYARAEPGDLVLRGPGVCLTTLEALSDGEVTTLTAVPAKNIIESLVRERKSGFPPQELSERAQPLPQLHGTSLSRRSEPEGRRE